MTRKHAVVTLSVLTLLGALITVPLTSCTFCPHPADPICSLIAETKPSEITSQDRKMVFEEPGTIIVHHGFACAESKRSGTEVILKVDESLILPAYATNATVFLNGWRVKYLGGNDHHVAALGTAIGNIRIEGDILKWQASGVLSDDNFDDEYSWCYNYTVVAWNPSNLNLTVDQKDGICDPRDQSEANFFTANNSGTTTALSSFASFLKNPEFASSKTVAILPRGFGFGWSCGKDHHLLQIGYDLDHSEIFIENGKKYMKRDQVVIPSLPSAASQVDSGFVSWETSTIFKDNSGRRDYVFGEIVSGLSGNDVGIIQPPFSILPKEDVSFCTAVGPDLKPEEFVIENVPFEFAIPMLTGWEIGYLCADEHVQEGGIWIDGWGYDRTTRTLRYKLSSILRDEGDPGYYRRHKVTILGLRALGGKIPSEKVPDLLPFSPSGTNPNAFCRMEGGGKQLRVTVKNQGNENAAASKTTVTFLNKPFTLDTPPISAGGSVDLLFNLPSGCFSPDCSFKITADSANQINESSNEGNNSANGRCIG